MKTGLFAHFCSQGSCRKGTVWEELVLRQRLFSSSTQGSLILLLLYEKKKKAPKIKVKEFLMRIKRPFIFKKRCRYYSKNKLFWTSPLAYICSVRTTGARAQIPKLAKAGNGSPCHRTTGRSLPGLLASNFEVLQDFVQNRIGKVS